MISTAKNFAGQNLRGRSFKEQDLSGADFSGADLKGTDFTDTILRGANFSQVKAGVQKRWLIFQVLIAFAVFTVSASLTAFTSLWTITILIPQDLDMFKIVPCILALLTLIVIFSAFLFQGFTTSSFTTVSVAVVTIGALAGTVALFGAINGNGAGAINVAGTVAGTVGLAAGVGAAVVGTVCASVSVGEAFSISMALIWTVGVVATTPIAVTMAGAEANVSVIMAVEVSVCLALAVILVSIYVAWRTLKGDPKFDLLLKFGIGFVSIGGSSFRGADLLNANFTKANLKSSDFRNSRKRSTNLTRAIWKGAKKLDRSRLGTSILANPEIRELLVTGKPNQNKSYKGLNLRGANLNGVYLKEVNFKRAILSEASFRNANLEWVNLTETQSIGTDFTGAQMTGVCLEGWSYDHTTKLNDVDCRFVFELEHPNALGSRERRPHDPDKEFVDGDFAKLYSETLNVVHLFIRNGINPEAFQTGWQKITQDYPTINYENIKKFEKKEEDVQLTVSVPEDMDKGKFERTFDLSYEAKVKEIEAKYQDQLLEAKEAIILLQKQNITDIKEILQIAKSPNINVSPTFQTEAKAVVEQNPVTIKAGRDISGNVINLGEIKGNVTNAINQIPTTDQSDRGDIKALLSQLQEAIDADSTLADEDKADALEHLEDLAKIAKGDKPDEASTLAGKTIRALNRIVSTLPNLTQILGAVSHFFGLA